MIDRSYLPFKSARAYKDRKMAKWMGFFLSDHQTALLQSHMNLEIDESMSLDNGDLQIRLQTGDEELFCDRQAQT